MKMFSRTFLHTQISVCFYIEPYQSFPFVSQVCLTPRAQKNQKFPSPRATRVHLRSTPTA